MDQNIEILECIEAFKQASNKDYLTKFYDRTKQGYYGLIFALWGNKRGQDQVE